MKPAEQEVLEVSRQWIASFNRGDVDACVAGYKSDAVVNAKPYGSFQGTEAIDGFWRPFMGSGAGDLVYSNVQVRAIDDQTVVLSADWSMNVGSGVTTLERWEKQPDGEWLLEQGDFEVLKQLP